MLNKSTFLVLAGSLSLAFGCDRALDEQADAVGAQAEANQDIAAANSQARDKAVSAQAEAAGRIADAQADFMKLRENFRHETTTKLVDVDRKIAVLEAEATTLTGKEKSDLETKLVSVRSERQRFAKDYPAIETASATTWDETKVRLHKQLEALDDALDATP